MPLQRCLKNTEKKLYKSYLETTSENSKIVFLTNMKVKLLVNISLLQFYLIYVIRSVTREIKFSGYDNQII